MTGLSNPRHKETLAPAPHKQGVPRLNNARTQLENTCALKIHSFVRPPLKSEYPVLHHLVQCIELSHVSGPAYMVCGALQNEEVTVNLRIRIPCSAPAGGWGGAQANPRMGNLVAYLQFYTIYVRSVPTRVRQNVQSV